MQLAQVEGFVEVARRGNLSRAAEALYLTQPALTARLQTLEEELGAPLFVRGRRGMTLTDTGRAFLPYAERALASLARRPSAGRELARGGTGELALGAAPAVSTYVLPALLVRFTARHPRVRLVVRTGHSEEILEMALRGEIASGSPARSATRMIECTPLYDDELVLVADPGTRWRRPRDVGVDRLREARLILFDRTSSYYELTNALFREAGVAPRGVMELDNIDAAKQMVEAGPGHRPAAANGRRGRARRRAACARSASRASRRSVGGSWRSGGADAPARRPASSAGFWDGARRDRRGAAARVDAGPTAERRGLSSPRRSPRRPTRPPSAGTLGGALSPSAASPGSSPSADDRLLLDLDRAAAGPWRRPRRRRSAASRRRDREVADVDRRLEVDERLDRVLDRLRQVVRQRPDADASRSGGAACRPAARPPGTCRPARAARRRSAPRSSGRGTGRRGAAGG